MAGETIDFNSGASLASLGFTSISGTISNAAGVGESSSYAMQALDRFDECSRNVTPAARPLCISFWWNRTVTNGSTYLFEQRAGGALLYNVSIQVVSGNQNLYVDSRAGYTETVASFWPSSFPQYVRIQIVPSTGGTFGSPASDGVIKIWWGDSLSSLTLHYDRSNIPIYDFTKDSPAQNAYGQFTFSPQGVIDNIVWSDSTCVDLTDPPDPSGHASNCCTAPTSAPGTGFAGVAPGGDPTGPFIPSSLTDCTGGGTVPTGTSPTAGETWTT